MSNSLDPHPNDRLDHAFKVASILIICYVALNIGSIFLPKNASIGKLINEVFLFVATYAAASLMAFLNFLDSLTPTFWSFLLLIFGIVVYFIRKEDRHIPPKKRA